MITMVWCKLYVKSIFFWVGMYCNAHLISAQHGLMMMTMMITTMLLLRLMRMMMTITNVCNPSWDRLQVHLIRVAHEWLKLLLDIRAIIKQRATVLWRRAIEFFIFYMCTVNLFKFSLKTRSYHMVLGSYEHFLSTHHELHISLQGFPWRPYTLVLKSLLSHFVMKKRGEVLESLQQYDIKCNRKTESRTSVNTRKSSHWRCHGSLGCRQNMIYSRLERLSI